MAPTRNELQRVLDSLPEGEWNNPHITSWEEDARTVYILVATKPDSGHIYFYDLDAGEFEKMKLPGQ